MEHCKFPWIRDISHILHTIVETAFHFLMKRVLCKAVFSHYALFFYIIDFSFYLNSKTGQALDSRVIIYIFGTKNKWRLDPPKIQYFLQMFKYLIALKNWNPMLQEWNQFNFWNISHQIYPNAHNISSTFPLLCCRITGKLHTPQHLNSTRKAFSDSYHFRRL